ncbi:MAG: VWA domain-containing protein [Caldilineaceae bacterium]
MNFLSPAAFALVLLLPIVVAMYLLRLQRTEQIVSSTYLWRRMVRDVEANAPWQKLRRNLLLLLQLLFLALLILALTRPFTWTDKPAGRTAVLVVDVSASMAAQDAVNTNTPVTRLSAAKTQMRQWIDGLPADAAVTLIAAAQRPQIVAAASQDRRQLYAALDALQPTLGGSDLPAALELASAVAARRTDAVIGLFSDFAGAETLTPTNGATVQFFPLGSSDNNQAISALTLNRTAGGAAQTLFAQVANYSSSPVQRRLTIAVGVDDGDALQLYNAYDLTLAPNGEQTIVADDLPANVTHVQAQLDEAADVLPLDDTAWAVAATGAANITLITDGNRFLETALALLPNLAVTTLKPADFEKSGAPPEPPQLTILDSYVPIAATLPTGNLLFIAPPASTELFSVTGVLEQPLAQAVDANAPLLRYVSLADVNVLEAARLLLPDWAQPIIVDGRMAGDESQPPLLFLGQPDERRVAVLAFDLRNSDLPLQVSFPLLLVNLTDWLTTGGAGVLPPVLPSDAPLTVPLPPAVTEAALIHPDGSSTQLLPGAQHTIQLTANQPGIYALAWDGKIQSRAALNLYAPQESNVRPQPAPTSSSVDANNGSEQASQTAQARREWWRGLAFAALALLMLEWLVYHRGTVAHLVQQTRRATAGE